MFVKRTFMSDIKVRFTNMRATSFMLQQIKRAMFVRVPQPAPKYSTNGITD